MGISVIVNVFADDRLCSNLLCITNIIKGKSWHCDISQENSNPLTWYIGLILLTSGDISTNPGPNRDSNVTNDDVSHFPCGLCEENVKWTEPGVCYDKCDIWYYKNCMNMTTFEYEGLNASSVTWICAKCDHESKS